MCVAAGQCSGPTVVPRDSNKPDTRRGERREQRHGLATVTSRELRRQVAPALKHGKWCNNKELIINNSSRSSL